jgi:hypothetical protein
MSPILSSLDKAEGAKKRYFNKIEVYFVLGKQTEGE